ncbi:MAG: NifU N-terminal domain-containing protein [Spirochaetaceae bacterium]|nr:NifU N-terminal domain-containing protein [Spirochaetaceae bacterium]
MKLIGIEPTPNPNSMKLVLDETLAPGVKATYRAGDEVSAPLMRGLLSIAGVAGVFHTADFMAVQRTPGTDWQGILAQVRTVFDAAAGVSAEVAVPRADGATQELRVSMQVFRDIRCRRRWPAVLRRSAADSGAASTRR